MITREVLCKIVEEVYGDIGKFLDDVESGCVRRFSIFCTINESVGNGDILILDNETKFYISWYKLSHLGRDIHTNIIGVSFLEDFIKAFKETMDREREEE